MSPRRRRRRRGRPAPAPTPFAVGMELFRRRHGRALGLRFHCRRCNGPIAEAMSVCPWCGTKDNSFAEITRAPLICPHCERGVLPEWTALPLVLGGTLQGNGRPPRPDPLAVRRCTRRGCAGRAASVHALLPGLQAEARPPVEPPGSRPSAARAVAGRCRRASGASAPGAAGASASPALEASPRAHRAPGVTVAFVLLGFELGLRAFWGGFYLKGDRTYVEPNAARGWANRPSTTAVYGEAEFHFIVHHNALGFRGREVAAEKTPGRAARARARRLVRVRHRRRRRRDLQRPPRGARSAPRSPELRGERLRNRAGALAAARCRARPAPGRGGARVLLERRRQQLRADLSALRAGAGRARLARADGRREEGTGAEAPRLAATQLRVPLRVGPAEDRRLSAEAPARHPGRDHGLRSRRRPGIRLAAHRQRSCARSAIRPRRSARRRSWWPCPTRSRWSRARRCSASAPADYEVQDRLRAICEPLGIPFLDLVPALRDEHARTGEALYYAKDRHLRARGHAIVAEALRAELDRLAPARSFVPVGLTVFIFQC